MVSLSRVVLQGAGTLEGLRLRMQQWQLMRPRRVRGRKLTQWGKNRGIGIARAKHPLGPFVKSAAPVASPSGLCGGSGRCDDVVMQATDDDMLHLCHSVKNSDVASGAAHQLQTTASCTIIRLTAAPHGPMRRLC